ncbi:hypothetical protein F5Y16DRAFT_420342 [Xylariaceae sp. FL0255]|nr:hypothetical protein F5Y16DRAFT_420342 [Xylariaceae sp. FL0255]
MMENTSTITPIPTTITAGSADTNSVTHQAQAQSRILYVLVYPSRLFAAHWSFFIPYSSSPHARDNNHHHPIGRGNRIHVTGDRLNGFRYEYDADYNPDDDPEGRTPGLYAVGVVSEASLTPFLGGTGGTINEVVGDGGDGEGGRDAAVNVFDKACKEIPAPGPSLNKVRDGDEEKRSIADGVKSAGAPRRMRAEVKDCQWWVREVISHLVETGIVLPLDGEACREETGDGNIEEAVEMREGERREPASLVGRLPRH